MKKRDVENIIRHSTEAFAPNVLGKVMNANVSRIPINERASVLRKKSAPRFALAFAMILIVVVSGVFFFTYMSGEAERVYIDINPSLELVINRYGRVKEAISHNAEAETLLQGYSIKGKPADNAISYFVEEAAEQGYLDNEDATVYISAYGKNGKVNDKVLQKFENAAKEAVTRSNSHAEVIKQEVSSEDKQEAEELQISLGKLKLINEILALDSSKTVETLKDKSMGELTALLRSLKDNNSHNGNQGNNDNQGNNGNQEDNETPANQGNNGNQGNSDNNGNQENNDNQGNSDNNGNQENNDNQGNSDNNGNQGNNGSNGNQDNNGDNGNIGNRDDKDHQGSQGDNGNQDNNGNNGNGNPHGNSGENEGDANNGNSGDHGNSGEETNPGNHGNSK
ncbi:MAG: hypothetical protein PHI19_06990 [Clostridia bacterium]|nr:hypothetical protein [Clostridia bacterium]